MRDVFEIVRDVVGGIETASEIVSALNREGYIIVPAKLTSIPICVACGKPAIGNCAGSSSVYHRTN